MIIYVGTQGFISLPMNALGPFDLGRDRIDTLRATASRIVWILG